MVPWRKTSGPVKVLAPARVKVLAKGPLTIKPPLLSAKPPLMVRLPFEALKTAGPARLLKIGRFMVSKLVERLTTLALLDKVSTLLPLAVRLKAPAPLVNVRPLML